MATTKRFSLWRELVPELKKYISDIQRLDRYTTLQLIEYLKYAVAGLDSISGLSSSYTLQWQFIPLSDGSIDLDKFENIDNITMNYGITQTVVGTAGSIESIAKQIIDKQIGMMTFKWTEELTGTGSSAVHPTIDVSFNKDPEDGEEIRGSFLVADNRIDAITNGVEIDVSMLLSTTIAVKWLFPINCGYWIKDTSVDLLLVNSSKMFQHSKNIVLSAAADILDHESLDAAKEGKQRDYVEILSQKAERYRELVQGKVGTSSASASKVSAIEHNIDRSSRTGKVFKKYANDIEFVAIVGNDITGKRIRYIDEQD